MPLATREERRRYAREWKARRRREWFAGKCCAFCKSEDHLEIDHIDPRLKVDHKVWSWAEERREIELSKCRVLCHKCHADRHSADQRRPIRHGTNNGYLKKCRCEACTRAHCECNREYCRRKRRGE